ncbi:hypothetical protein [Streptomyces sp. NPDC048669]|uniref:hypothetical protein n=1 Tax=Streptomyces sp. NPDC048669 TaxID=3155267 RepID=UPI00343B85D0
MGLPVIEALAPRPGEHVLPNVRPNAFLHSHPGRLLRSTGRTTDGLLRDLLLGRVHRDA